MIRAILLPGLRSIADSDAFYKAKGYNTSWTYSGNPALSLLDAVRFCLGDTNPASPVATDEECLYALAQQSQQPLLAAALLAEAKATSFVVGIQRLKVGDTSIDYGDQAKDWLALARKLREEASLATVIPIYAGGISVSDKAANAAQADNVAPFARRGLHDAPHGHPEEEWD